MEVSHFHYMERPTPRDIRRLATVLRTDVDLLIESDYERGDLDDIVKREYNTKSIEQVRLSIPFNKSWFVIKPVIVELKFNTNET